MRIPSDEEVQAAFGVHVHRVSADAPDTFPSSGMEDPGKEWVIGVGGYPVVRRTGTEARQIVRACLTLGVMVSDRIDGSAWVSMVTGVAGILERLEMAEAQLRVLQARSVAHR